MLTISDGNVASETSFLKYLGLWLGAVAVEFYLYPTLKELYTLIHILTSQPCSAN